MSVLMLELNEINFDQVRDYAAQGKLPNFKALIDRHGVSETTSEQSYEDLEPWIQWVTAHTGQSLAEHGVFRLGDILGRDLDQIWEILERQGVSVGAISPMNASNRCEKPAFFVPDPWTRTELTASPALRGLHGSVAQAVNDNATARISAGSAAHLIRGLVRYARPSRYAGYLADVFGAARKKAWRKAMFLDRLLADVFIREVSSHRPGFASLFLNAGAHIQHHYLFSSGVYRGAQRNPAWYVAPGDDPLLEVYTLYDTIVGDVRRRFPDARILLATGLHQVPHGEVTYYWRLRDHADFLRRAGIDFARVEPRMSRDFVVFAADAEGAQRAERQLAGIRMLDGRPLFRVDNRGDSLFVEFAWADDVPDDARYLVGNREVTGLHEDVAFVAIKNGEHDGTGYLLDTGARHAATLPLTDMPRIVADACGVAWPAPRRAAAV